MRRTAPRLASAFRPARAAVPRAFVAAAVGAAIGAGAVYLKASEQPLPAAPLRRLPAVQCKKSKAAPPFNAADLRRDIEAIIEDAPELGPAFVRLAWHEAGTWDCTKKDGSPNSASMRFAPECAHGANAGLGKARDALEPLRRKHFISYADLWSLAGCVAIEAAGGPAVTWRWGRKDATGPQQCAPDGRLPDAAQGENHVREVFARMGFNDRETTALIGAHALGECHRDYSGYVGPWTHDKYGFANAFYTTLLENDWVVNHDTPFLQFTDAETKTLMMLPADVAFLRDKEYRKHVQAYAADQDLFFKDFAAAYQKLVELGQHDLMSL